MRDGIARGTARHHQAHGSDQGEGAAASPASHRRAGTSSLHAAQGGRGDDAGQAGDGCGAACRRQARTRRPHVLPSRHRRGCRVQPIVRGQSVRGQAGRPGCDRPDRRSSSPAPSSIAPASRRSTSWPRPPRPAPACSIEVGGHASIEGSADSNQQLSVRRAQSVVTYLVKAGVDVDAAAAGRLRCNAGRSRPTTPARTWRRTGASSSPCGRNSARPRTAGLGANGLSRLQAVLVAGGRVRDRSGDRLAVLQPEAERPA